MAGGYLMPPLSSYAQRQIAQQRTVASIPFLIKITHPEYPPMLYANSSTNITYNGEVYNAATFSIQPPDRDGAKMGTATLTISAIDQVWVEKIRATQKPAKLQFIAIIVYNEGSISGVEPLDENCFTLRVANWNEISITWSMIFDENQSIMVPSDKCNAQTTPGCA
jgi:hypothetical protein